MWTEEVCKDLNIRKQEKEKKHRNKEEERRRKKEKEKWEKEEQNCEQKVKQLYRRRGWG